MNMHEQIYIDNQFQFKLLASLPPVTVCGQWQEWKNRMKSMEINMLAKLKTRKGGLGKNEHPDGLTTFKGNSGKSRGKQENYSPVGRKPERAIQAKMGWWKNEKWNERKQTCKSINHRCDVQSTYVTVPTSSNTFQTVFLYDVTASCLQWRSRCIFKRPHPQKKGLCKYMSEREPLRAQYSSGLSVSAKLCLQIANHHAFQNIHTCIIMHLTCSCIW